MNVDGREDTISISWNARHATMRCAAIALSLLAASVDGFTLTPVAPGRGSSRTAATEMVLGYKVAAGAAVSGIAGTRAHAMPSLLRCGWPIS